MEVRLSLTSFLFLGDGLRGDDGGEENEQSRRCGGNNQSFTEATELRGEDAREPGQGRSANGGGGKERAKPGVFAGSGEQERHDERVERSKAKRAENGERDDTGGGWMCCGAEQNLGEDKQSETDAVERGFAEEGHQRSDEDAAGELGYPEADGDGRGMERWVGADGIAGQPA